MELVRLALTPCVGSNQNYLSLSLSLSHTHSQTRNVELTGRPDSTNILFAFLMSRNLPGNLQILAGNIILILC